MNKPRRGEMDKCRLNNIAPKELNKPYFKLSIIILPALGLFMVIETKIDRLVYQLYDLTEDEIGIVEGK